MFATNVSGPLTVPREVLPVLHGQGAGNHVFVSSVGGFTQNSDRGLRRDESGHRGMG